MTMSHSFQEIKILFFLVPDHPPALCFNNHLVPLEEQLHSLVIVAITQDDLTSCPVVRFKRSEEAFLDVATVLSTTVNPASEEEL